MNPNDPRQRSTPTDQSPRQVDVVVPPRDGASKLLDHLRGRPAPVSVVTTGAANFMSKNGPVEVLDGAGSLRGPGGTPVLADVYAHTTGTGGGAGGGIGGMGPVVGGGAHVTGDQVNEEWVIRDPVAYAKKWPDGTELRQTSSSVTVVYADQQVLQELHDDTTPQGGPLPYALVPLVYWGFPTGQAIDGVQNYQPPAGVKIDTYEIQCIHPGQPPVLGGRLLRERPESGPFNAASFREHWLLTTQYAFPQGVTSWLRFQQAELGSTFEFFDAVRNDPQYTGGLYVYLEYTLGPLPPLS